MVAMVIGITCIIVGKWWTTKNERMLGAWEIATMLGQASGWWQWFYETQRTTSKEVDYLME
jgi:hypothetical protein